ncbi:hypothetical protein ACTFIR_009726 [Dictyostelium discoideum]
MTLFWYAIGALYLYKQLIGPKTYYGFSGISQIKKLAIPKISFNVYKSASKFINKEFNFVKLKRFKEFNFLKINDEELNEMEFITIYVQGKILRLPLTIKELVYLIFHLYKVEIITGENIKIIFKKLKLNFPGYQTFINEICYSIDRDVGINTIIKLIIQTIEIDQELNTQQQIQTQKKQIQQQIQIQIKQEKIIQNQKEIIQNNEKIIQNQKKIIQELNHTNSKY